MNNASIKFICTSIAFGITISCTNQSNNTQNSSDSLANQSRSGSLDTGLPDNDSVLNYRNGVVPNVDKSRSGTDTLQLPNSILEAIMNDNVLKNSRIVDMKETVENGASYYELVFYPVNGKEEKVIFDSQGKRKQKP